MLTVVKETAGCFVQLPSNRGRQGSDPHWVALFKESRLAGFDENSRSSMWLGGSTAMGTVYSHIRALCPCSLFYLVGCLSRPIQVLAQSFFLHAYIIRAYQIIFVPDVLGLKYRRIMFWPFLSSSPVRFLSSASSISKQATQGVISGSLVLTAAATQRSLSTELLVASEGERE